MSAINVASFEELEQQISKLKDYLKSKQRHELMPPAEPLFRGQAEASWPLTTSIERFRPSEITTVEEYNHYLSGIKPAIESFTRQRWKFERHPQLPDSLFTVPPNYEFMVYARHHGFPSPLLDWTRSPYIAVYFAYCDARPEQDVAVFAYVSAPEGSKGGFVRSPMISELGPYATTDPRHFMQQAQYTVCTQKPDSNWEYCSHEKCVSSSPESHQDLLRKYTLPSSLRVTILKRLDQMNLNHYTLFGGEDSLARTLAFREITCSNI